VAFTVWSLRFARHWLAAGHLLRQPSECAGAGQGAAAGPRDNPRHRRRAHATSLSITELYRHKGRLLLSRRKFDDAEKLYRKALSIAREQEAKLWELRAAVSFARLRRDQDRRTEAFDLLASIYGWFIEGFDTPDLKEAKAPLEELG